MKNRQNSLVTVIVLIIVLLIIGGCIHLYSQKNQSTQNNLVQPNLSGWKTYTNEKYGFTFMYPPTATVIEGGHFGGGIPNSGQVQFNVSFPDHITDGPPGVELFSFEVQPSINPPYTTTDGLYQTYERSLGSHGYSVQKFTLGDNTGVLYFLHSTSTQTTSESCSAEVDILHGSYNFTMPPLFGTIFAPQTSIGNCTKNSWAGISNDYIKTLSSFKFI